MNRLDTESKPLYHVRTAAMSDVPHKIGPKLTEEATVTYNASGNTPKELIDHITDKHWVLAGMTAREFSDAHSGTQFNFAELRKEMIKIMPDMEQPFNPDDRLFCIEFASLVLFTIGPATRSVKQGARDKTWGITVPAPDGKSVNTIFVCTYKAKPPVVAQPRLVDNKICLTIKQASLIAILILNKLTDAVCDDKKILLTPLAGAIFSKDDIVKISQATGKTLKQTISIINSSAQSGGFYLSRSEAAVAAVCAVVATQNADSKIASTIITKTVKQYIHNHKQLVLSDYDTYCQFATGGVPTGMSAKDLQERLKMRQEAFTAAAMREYKKTELSTKSSIIDITKEMEQVHVLKPPTTQEEQDF